MDLSYEPDITEAALASAEAAAAAAAAIERERVLREAAEQQEANRKLEVELKAAQHTNRLKALTDRLAQKQGEWRATCEAVAEVQANLAIADDSAKHELSSAAAAAIEEEIATLTEELAEATRQREEEERRITAAIEEAHAKQVAHLEKQRAASITAACAASTARAEARAKLTALNFLAEDECI